MFWYYLLVKLDDFNMAAGIVMCLSGFITALLSLHTVIESCNIYSNFEKEIAVKIKILKFSIPVFIISLLFTTFVPSTKQAAFIWIAPQIVENGAVKDTVKNIPELTKLGTEYLKELLKEKVNDVAK